MCVGVTLQKIGDLQKEGGGRYVPFACRKGCSLEDMGNVTFFERDGEKIAPFLRDTGSVFIKCLSVCSVWKE